MKDIKDKPDFEFEAESYADAHERRGCTYWLGLKMGAKAGMEQIWNDYHLPALKRIEELEKQLNPDFKN